MKTLLLLICCSVLPALIFAQESETRGSETEATGAEGQVSNSDNNYRRKLTSVLTEIEQRYGLSLEYSEDLVKDLWLDYAGWRFRPDAEETLRNVLGPLDLTYSKEGDRRYEIAPFRYHLRTVDEGRRMVQYLASLYDDASSWEERKEQLRSCMFEALKLSPLPASPGSDPIITGKRKMDGYTIENIAIELLPGLYVNGSLYKPDRIKGKIPVILCPDGHWQEHRYRADCQYRCATLARMGAMAFSYDLFAWGESLLQFEPEDHRRSLAMTVQALGSIRILDYLLSLEQADTGRVAISGGSGGGSQTMLITALDDRIKVSAPVVMLSSYHSGGCPCESGMPVHLCQGGTNNVEIAAMAAPRPQLVVSDGNDWTANVPGIAFPYLQKMYGYYGKEELVSNVHLPDEGHDFGYSKRVAVYRFMAEYLGLDLAAVSDASGKIDESACTIEEPEAMYVFGPDGEDLPANAIMGFDNLERVFNKATNE